MLIESRELLPSVHGSCPTFPSIAYFSFFARLREFLPFRVVFRTPFFLLVSVRPVHFRRGLPFGHGTSGL